MPIDDVDKLRTFVSVADHGGLAGAVVALGAPKSTLSRKLAALEAQVGARLIDRSGRRFRLTEAGATAYRHAIRILAEVEHLHDALQGGEPSGLLRVTTTLGLAAEILGPILPDFLERYPKIDVDLEANSQLRDLARDDFDVALRAGPLTGGSMTAKRLGVMEVGLFAAPAYLERINAEPQTVSARATLSLNRDGRRRQSPPNAAGGERSPRSRLSVNDPLLLRAHVVAGNGTAWLPLYMCKGDLASGRLVRCRPNETLRGAELFALFPGQKDIREKTRAFVDFLADRLRLER